MSMSNSDSGCFSLDILEFFVFSPFIRCLTQPSHSRIPCLLLLRCPLQPPPVLCHQPSIPLLLHSLAPQNLPTTSQRQTSVFVISRLGSRSRETENRFDPGGEIREEKILYIGSRSVRLFQPVYRKGKGGVLRMLGLNWHDAAYIVEDGCRKSEFGKGFQQLATGSAS